VLQGKGEARDRLQRRLHKKTKGSKIHAAVVTSISLPIAIGVGMSGNEQHESRRLITLIKGIRIKTIRRSKSRPKCVYTDNKYHTPLLVMMYLASRDIIAARIKKRVNWKRKPRRLGLFDYETYAKIRVVSRDSLVG
jgi:hypothetical protein